jgi:hypothetical protein
VDFQAIRLPRQKKMFISDIQINYNRAKLIG